MSKLAVQLNQLYLNEMQRAREDTVLGRVRTLWWKFFLESVKTQGFERTLNTLDSCMAQGIENFRRLADEYASAGGHLPGSRESIQAITQFLKSNTGKMFERLIGLSLAHALAENKANYCIVPFRQDMIRHCHSLTVDSFSVTVQLGNEWLQTFIDADLLAFNPEKKDADIFMISVKSTLKDRFHNVPFWNLLRLLAYGNDVSNIRAVNADVLARMKYIAVCSDLAKEQPDFAGELGPRKLLKIDAALLDGAYVTAERAQGLGTGFDALGPSRSSAFYPYGAFFLRLLGSK